MFIVRVTFKSGKQFFINEGKFLVLVDEAKDAYKYNTTLEFKVSWKLWKTSDCTYSQNVWVGSWNKEDVVKFETIEQFNVTASDLGKKLKGKAFDIHKQEVKIGTRLFFEPVAFERLKKCGITSSHWCYDAKGEWIAFPKTAEDYAKIVKIDYYYRGLVDTITSHNNWEDRYNEHSWHGCYEAHHKNMLHPIIQQLCLLKIDSCERFSVYPKKVKPKK